MNNEIKDDPLFLDTMRQLRKGGAANEIGESLRKLVKLVEEHNSTGELIVTIKVKPNGNGQVMVVDDHKVKEPKRLSGGASVFFVDSEASLRRDDPKQPNLPFAESEERSRKGA